jgi:hypothetical protein
MSRLQTMSIGSSFIIGQNHRVEIPRKSDFFEWKIYRYFAEIRLLEWYAREE